MEIIQIPVKFIADSFDLYQDSIGTVDFPYSTRKYSIYNCIPLAIFLGLSRYSIQRISRFINIVKSKWNIRYNYNLDKLYKFNESFIKLLYYYITYSSICQILKYEENIFPDISNVWKDFENQIISLNTSAYYIFELSWYISEIFFLSKSNKDFTVMIIHHIFTISLIGLSYIFGFHRIGILVLYCHNINDIFLESAKCLKYLGFIISSNICFIFLILSWIYSRLYIFPFYVLKSAMFDSYKILFSNENYNIIYYICNTFLVGLLCMHIYWFYLICKIAWKSIRSGKTEDIREE